MSLRVDPRTSEVILVIPAQSRLREAQSSRAIEKIEKTALRFVDENKDWIDKQRRASPAEKILEDGGKIPFLGRDYTLVHKTGRGLARFDGSTIIVHGRTEHVQRRLRDFLKKEARVVLDDRAKEKAILIGKHKIQVDIRDPKSRWGSCAANGRLMFSWRIVLAPEYVLDYLVAHEVAHLAHMNHSKRFWALCLSLCENGLAARRWLKRHGRELMAY